MAVYYFNISRVQRSKGHSAVAAAAYRHGRKMRSEMEGRTWNYSDREDVVHGEITLPEDAPVWMEEAFGSVALSRLIDGREATDAVLMDAVGQLSDGLWNDVETFEQWNNIHAKRAQTAAKINLALPVELTFEEQKELTRSFIQSSLSPHGAVVDWVIHDPPPKPGKERNPHVHLMFTLRGAGAETWGRKNRIWDRRSQVRGLRMEWAREANIALEKAGCSERIDHRKLVEQGVELEPVSYDKTLAMVLEERGEVYRRKVRAEDALVANRDFLRETPEHVLSVVAAERTMFQRSDLIKVLRRQGFEKAEADALCDAAMRSDIVVALPETTEAGEALFTTETQLHIASNMMADAVDLAASSLGGVEAEGAAVPELDAGQQTALAEMISARRLSLVSGYAGAGKTHVIAAAADIWSKRGFAVLGGAVSGRATQNLDGIETMETASLAAWEARWARGETPPQGRFVLFMDEAGMVGTETWDRVQRQVSRMGGKLIAVGDPEQLQPVLDTGAFPHLMSRIGGPVIGTIRRIRDAKDRAATVAFAQGQAAAKRALAHYRSTGAIVECADRGAAIEALAAAYFEASTAPAAAAAGGQARDAGTGADPFGPGSGPIVLAPRALKEVRQVSPRSEAARLTLVKGPSVAEARAALDGQAEALFRAAFGEPVSVRGREWRSTDSSAVAMQMRGPNRGLWMDHRTGEGGDLLDLVAQVFCGLTEAHQDFPRVMAEAVRFTGLTPEAVQSLPEVKTRAEARARADDLARQEGEKRAALVEALCAAAMPVSGSPGVAYLKERGITDLPMSELGWLDPVPGQPVRAPEHGALVVWARNAQGAIVGGQRILIDEAGGAIRSEVKKPAFGTLSGAAARFPARGALRERPQPLVVAEGPETALSIWQATGIETWAVFGFSGWKSTPLPTDRPVIFAPDRDAPDSPAAEAFEAAVHHHLSAGVDLSIAAAPEEAGSTRDLNDTDRRAGSAAVRAAIAAARPVLLVGSDDPRRSVPPAAEPTRLAMAYSGRDVDVLNAAIRDQAARSGRLDLTQEIAYGPIERIDRSGLQPRRYGAPFKLAPGDRVIFTKPHRALGIAKSSFATVAATRPASIDLRLDGEGGRDVRIDISAFDHFDYGYAVTAHKAQGVSVDHGLALAHPRMRRPVSYVMMSRHRDSTRMFIPSDRFAGLSFDEVATADDISLIDAPEGRRPEPIAGQTFAATEQAGRADALDALEPGVNALSPVRFAQDPHLHAVMRRHAGLLASGWAAGDLVIGDDPAGYAAAPRRVIEDLAARQSVFGADDVALILGRVAPHPDTFMRLYREALSHPDLLAVPPEAGRQSRLYTTGAQADREFDALDMGVALALAHDDPGLGVGTGLIEGILAAAGLDASAQSAARHGGEARQIALITGSGGSGKTAVLGALADAHETAGRVVLRVAGTSALAEVFSETSGRQVHGVGGFLRGLAEDRITLNGDSVVVLDEAAEISADQAIQFFDALRLSGAKLIAAWDPDQPHGLEASPVFDDLAQRVGAARLEGHHRQRTSLARAMVERLGRDLPNDLARHLEAAGALRAGPAGEGAIAALLDGWIADPSERKVIVAATASEADDINTAFAIRQASDPALAGLPATPARTLQACRGRGIGSVHLYATELLRRSGLYAALGLVEERVQIVVPMRGPEGARGAAHGLARIAARGDRRTSVADLVLDPDLSAAAAADHIRQMRRIARGAHSPWAARAETDAVDLTPEALTAEPERMVDVIAAERARFTIADLRRAFERRVPASPGDTDQLVSRALASRDIVWLEETAPDGSPVFTTRANENAAYLLAHPEHIFTLIGAEQAVFTLADIDEAFRQRLPKGSDVDALMTEVKASPALQPIDGTGPQGGRLYTTSAHVATEAGLIEQAREMRLARLQGGSVDDDSRLSEQITGAQARAGEAMLDDRRLVLVRGVAGAGKTTVMREAARIWAERGYDVIGGSLGSRAAQELGDGVPQMTVASLAAWEARWARGWRPSGEGFVFFMDEAAMVGTGVWARVQDRIEKLGGKLIAVGDPEQLPPVSDGSAWRAVEAQTGSVTIDRVRRQNDPDHRARTEQLAAGGALAAQALRAYAENGNVRFSDVPEDAIAALVQAYTNAPGRGADRLAMAYSRADVAKLNEAIRARLIERGEVARDSERAFGAGEDAISLGVGDRVTFSSALKDVEVPKNSFGTVTATVADGVTIRLDGAEARQVALDPDDAGALAHGYATTVHKSQGMTVDHAFALAHGYMDRHTLYVAMSRHRKSAELFVPRSRIATLDRLCNLAMMSRYRSLQTRVSDASVQRRSSAGLADTEFALRTDAIEPAGQLERASFEEDAHLAGILGRMTGLLADAHEAGTSAPGDDPRGYGEAPGRVVDDLVARDAVFGADAVAQVLARVAPEPERFARLFREAMRHPDLIALTETDPEGGGRLYTTEHHLALELRVMDRGVRLALDTDTRAPSLDPRYFAGLVKERSLTEEQADALRLTASGQRLSIVSGRSGAGKTFIAGALADLHTRQGWEVIAISPTGRGVDSLRREGAVRSMTINAFEAALRDERVKLTANTVVLLDGAGQVGAAAADRILELIDTSGAKLVALTDDDQPGPPEATPVFRTLAARVGSVALGENLRQRDPELLAFTRQLGSRLDAAQAVTRLETQGRLKAGGTRARAIERLAEDYVADPREDRVALTLSRRDAAAVTGAIRARLDLMYPERDQGADRTAPEGSVGALRKGDRIVLKSWYGPAGLRPGSEAVVERRARERVQLRVGAGDAARHIRVKDSDPNFSYDFAFASTVHGARGRAADSVHILAAPGMSRDVLYTGAALARDDLSVVVPVTQDRAPQALQAIVRTETTARSALDYGFDASKHVREAVRAASSSAPLTPSALRDGLDRALDWVADRLDGGVGGTPAVSPARGRLTQLRSEVVAELIAAHREETGQPVDLKVRADLEGKIERLVLGQGWRRFLSEGRSMRAFEADAASSRDADAAPREAMIAKVLERGVRVAEATGEDDLARWFTRAHDTVRSEIDARREAYETALADVETMPFDRPEPSAEVRARIAETMKRLGARAPDHVTVPGQEKAMEIPEHERPTIRAEVFEALKTGAATKTHYAQAPALFTVLEYRAITDRSEPWPESLPKVSDAERDVIATTMERLRDAAHGEVGAIGANPAGLSGEHQPVAAGEARATALSDMEPNRRPNSRDLAFSLASMVSQHIKVHDPAHEGDVQARIRELIDTVGERRADEPEPSTIASNIADWRLRVDVQRKVLKDMGQEKWTEDVLYAKSSAAFLASRYTEDDFEDRVEAEWQERLAESRPKPTVYDRAVGEILSRENADNHLALTVSEALTYGDPQSADALRAARSNHLTALAEGKAPTHRDADQFIDALFAAFSHSEVDALVNPDAPLPKSLPTLDPATRIVVAHVFRQAYGNATPDRSAPGIAKGAAMGFTKGTGPNPDIGPGW